MLSRSQRLNGRTFDDVMKKGRVVHSPLFVARILKSDSAAGLGGIAAVVPVKIGKTSALRHLVRRRIYEATRYILKDISSGHAIILFAKAAALEKKPSELAHEIKAIFVKAGLLR